MISRKLARPATQIGKARIALSAKIPHHVARLVNARAAHAASKVGGMAPDEALTTLRGLASAMDELSATIEASEGIAADLELAARALLGEDIEGGSVATFTAMGAAAALDQVRMLSPDADLSSVADCITALRRSAHEITQHAEAARKRMSASAKAMAQAVEGALANPASSPSAILGRYQCSPSVQLALDRALAEGRTDAELRGICDAAITSRLNALRKEKRDRADRAAARIEQEAARAWS